MLPMYLSNRHSTSPLDGDKWSGLRSYRFAPETKASGTHLLLSWSQSFPIQATYAAQRNLDSTTLIIQL